jgi:hypothetical protein
MSSKRMRPLPSLPLLAGLWITTVPRAAVRSMSSSVSQTLCAMERRSVRTPILSR